MIEKPDFAFIINAGNQSDPWSGDDTQLAVLRGEKLGKIAQLASSRLESGQPATIVVVEAVSALENSRYFPGGDSAPVREDGIRYGDAGYHDGELDHGIVVNGLKGVARPIIVAKRVPTLGSYSGDSLKREINLVPMADGSSAELPEEPYAPSSVDGSVAMVAWDGTGASSAGSAGGRSDDPPGRHTLLIGDNMFASTIGAAFVSDADMSRHPGSGVARDLVQAMEGGTHPQVVAENAAKRIRLGGAVLVDNRGRIGGEGKGDPLLVAVNFKGKTTPQVMRLRTGSRVQG